MTYFIWKVYLSDDKTPVDLRLLYDIFWGLKTLWAKSSTIQLYILKANILLKIIFLSAFLLKTCFLNLIVIHDSKILGPPVDDCTWTGWIDNDNPLRHCDCESPPDGCLVQDYQIKDMSTGTVYILDIKLFASFFHFANPCLNYCKVVSSRPVYYSILNYFDQRRETNVPIHKRS